MFRQTYFENYLKEKKKGFIENNIKQSEIWNIENTKSNVWLKNTFLEVLFFVTLRESNTVTYLANATNLSRKGLCLSPLGLKHVTEPTDQRTQRVTCGFESFESLMDAYFIGKIGIDTLAVIEIM